MLQGLQNELQTSNALS